MRPFNLDEYLENPNRKVVTRDGKLVKILCTNLISDKPVVAQIDDTRYSRLYTKDGKCSLCQNSIDDLFFIPEKKEGWINLFKDYDSRYVGYKIFKSKEEAKKVKSTATIKIEWEE